MKILKKIWMYFLTKKKLIEMFYEQNEILEVDLQGICERIKLLDQDKLYYIQVTEKQLNISETMINKIIKKIPWTVPTILLCTESIKEIPPEILQKKIREFSEKTQR